jgi:ribosomal protein L37AE/L43A
LAWTQVTRSARAIKTAKIREQKRARRECRQCTKPAVVKNGKQLAMCQHHLDQDSERKATNKA